MTVVKRSAVRMWLLAMGGIPLLIISLDVLTNRRLSDWLREIVFRPEDTQIYESRDVIWAWVMLFFAVFLVLWGLKELFLPTRVVECREEGLALKIAGPFRSPAILDWVLIRDVWGATAPDEGREVSVLAIEVTGRGELPENPWGARWADERLLAVLAEDWASDPEDVAEGITRYAVDVARRSSRTAVKSLWGRDEEE